MSELSYLEKLLDGVEVKWLPLGHIAAIKTGQSVNKNMISKNPGVYPVINSGREPLGFINTWNTDNDPIGITTRGAGVGSVIWQEGKYFRGNLNYSITIDKKSHINIRYMYHALLHMKNDIHELCTFDGIPALNAGSLKKLLIPIPCPNIPEKSLAIQSEIVRILDKFTALTAELTAELNMRKKQYNYYRDQLLSFEEGEVEWKTLGDIGDVRMCKRILKNETLPEGDVPFYKIGTFGKKANAFISRDVFEAYKNKYSFPKKGDVLISASGTIGRTVIYDGEPAYFQDSNIVWLENDESIVTNKYLWHFYKIAKWAVSEGGTIDRLYNDNIRKTKIIVPYPSDPSKSLAEQNRVVAILEKFDALTSSISEGLPREIELRQKQYEYYRDLLFSFPKPEAASN
ncbi:TPA: restriction endonuclease subunit S [Escherichia coli]|uniref:restriction endonuclease subunit S n=1 Tax=Escherichia coli TaxID=562 RepID=UPI000DA5E3E2|nr:restriction endonuclease subunit S [Escherichia coli]EFN8570051.1 restriction endonuclease subunit S [Escherichia coli O85:H32]EFH6116107.1 restriction endonuclease subunit S [Escherichia coli]EFS3806021.1 restriction endonuclease subunit S [Escherichia coli]EGI4300284.1 restriction endonuclease subunit S [Escherichia coli]EGY1316175.1 restriction endonuclease subunit S [Escherichia coli]